MATPAVAGIRPHWRPGLVLAGDLFVLAVLIISMHCVPRLDPSGFQGRHVGTAMTAAWCAGLGVFSLGVVRQHNSRFTLRTLATLTAVIAIYLGLCRAFHPVFPTMAVAAGFSIAMLYEAQVADREPKPFRGRLCRAIMAVGGLIFLAHSIRVLGFFVLIGLGLVRAH